MMSLTRRQAECLAFISGYLVTHQEGPSLPEIARGIGVNSSSAVQHLLRRLKERGRIDWLPGKSRSIRLTGEAPVTLPPALLATLAVFCAERGEDPSAAVADAVTLYLDQMTGGAS
jgi:repressor LexA